MSFDLVTYAQQHGLRTRNLHDGDPCPPVRRSRTGRRGYVGKTDRHDVLICRRGYVDAAGPGQIGVTVLRRSPRGLTNSLTPLRALGVAFTQIGDTEAAGTAPVASVEAVLHELRPWRARNPVQCGLNRAVFNAMPTGGTSAPHAEIDPRSGK